MLSSAGLAAAVAEPAACPVGGGGSSAPSWAQEGESPAAALTHTPHGEEEGVEVTKVPPALVRQKRGALAASWAKLLPLLRAGEGEIAETVLERIDPPPDVGRANGRPPGLRRGAPPWPSQMCPPKQTCFTT